MDKVFVDTDVILDFLLDREPFTLDAARVFSLAEKKKLHACTTGLVFANAYYVLRKLASHKKVVEKLTELSQWVDIIGLPKVAVTNALKSGFSDFEDALQYFSAMEAGVKIILTRNVKDYKHSELAVMTPEIYIRQS